jgi:hypothetical protein
MAEVTAARTVRAEEEGMVGRILGASNPGILHAARCEIVGKTLRACLLQEVQVSSLYGALLKRRLK